MSPARFASHTGSRWSFLSILLSSQMESSRFQVRPGCNRPSRVFLVSSTSCLKPIFIGIGGGKCIETACEKKGTCSKGISELGADF